MSSGGRGDRCAGLTNLPLACADFQKFWEPQPPGAIRVCLGLHKDSCYHFTIYVQGVQLKSGPILIGVIYLLRFTTCYITQLTSIYSKYWE